MKKINFSFRYSDSNLLKKSDYILSCMTGNTAFTDPFPTLIAIKAAHTKYQADLTAAAGRDRILVAEKNKSRKILESLYKQLGMYIMSIANGDEAILAATGFTTAKIPEPGHLASPGNVTLTNGVASGQLISRIKGVKYAKIYFHEITSDFPNADAKWIRIYSTTSRHVFTNLEPGKKYWVRVAAAGTNGQVVYSPIASHISL